MNRANKSMLRKSFGTKTVRNLFPDGKTNALAQGAEDVPQILPVTPVATTRRQRLKTPDASLKRQAKALRFLIAPYERTSD
jgi:hypothetical protein